MKKTAFLIIMAFFFVGLSVFGQKHVPNKEIDDKVDIQVEQLKKDILLNEEQIDEVKEVFFTYFFKLKKLEERNPEQRHSIIVFYEKEKNDALKELLSSEQFNKYMQVPFKTDKNLEILPVK